MPDIYEIILDPQKYGYTQCPHCNGYGSSVKEPERADTCTMRDCWSLIRKNEESNYEYKSNM